MFISGNHDLALRTVVPQAIGDLFFFLSGCRDARFDSLEPPFILFVLHGLTQW